VESKFQNEVYRAADHQREAQLESQASIPAPEDSRRNKQVKFLIAQAGEKFHRSSEPFTQPLQK